MKSGVAILVGLSVICVPARPQARGAEVRLAHLLASEGRRSEGIAEVAASNGRLVPLLISWTRQTPAEFSSILDRHELYVGLADCFAELRTKEAMPFLVQNVGLERLLTGGKMMAGTPEGMASEEGLVSMPAARALVRIGPDSSAALIDAYWKSMSARDRMVALSVIGRIGATGAREFLGHVMQEADWERSRAADALKRLDARAK